MTSSMPLNPNATPFVPKSFQDNSNFEIPKITNYDGLQQVAQIAYCNLTCKPSYYELYWDGQRVILDNSHNSWQFPDMTIRQIIHSHFDETPLEFAEENTALDEPASNAGAIIVTITPILTC